MNPLPRTLALLLWCPVALVRAQDSTVSSIPSEALLSLSGQSEGRELLVPLAQPRSSDSLDLRLLGLEVLRAKIAARKTCFLSRLIPKLTFSSSVGMKDYMYINPEAALALPHDSYRLTLTVSFNDIFDFGSHELSLVQLEKAKLDHRRGILRQCESQLILGAKAADLNADIEATRAELEIVLQLMHYNELLFQRGKADFTTLAHSRLRVLNVKRNLRHLRSQLEQLRQ